MNSKWEIPIDLVIVFFRVSHLFLFQILSSFVLDFCVFVCAKDQSKEQQEFALRSGSCYIKIQSSRLKISI